MARYNNPQFPHTCVVYRMIGETSFDDGRKEILYEGRCRKTYAQERVFKTSNVVRGEYQLSVPGIVGNIQSGDLIDVTDKSGTYERCLVADCYAGNLGTTVFFDIPKN